MSVSKNSNPDILASRCYYVNMNMIRTTISLPTDIHEEWRMEAVKRRMSLGEIIIEKTKAKRKSADENFSEILRQTAGSWGPATKEDKAREARQRKIEMAASRKLKNAW